MPGEKILICDDEEKTRIRSISVADATRREHFGYATPMTPQEIFTVEHYAETQGLSRAELHRNPLIFTGVYAFLVGMGELSGPPLPEMVQSQKPDAAAEVAAQAKSAPDLPPSTSGAPASPKPYSHKGKTPSQVLADMQAAGQDFGGELITDEVLASMGED